MAVTTLDRLDEERRRQDSALLKRATRGTPEIVPASAPTSEGQYKVSTLPAVEGNTATPQVTHFPKEWYSNRDDAGLSGEDLVGIDLQTTRGGTSPTKYANRTMFLDDIGRLPSGADLDRHLGTPKRTTGVRMSGSPRDILLSPDRNKSLGQNINNNIQYQLGRPTRPSQATTLPTDSPKPRLPGDPTLPKQNVPLPAPTDDPIQNLDLGVSPGQDASGNTYKVPEELLEPDPNVQLNNQDYIIPPEEGYDPFKPQTRTQVSFSQRPYQTPEEYTNPIEIKSLDVTYNTDTEANRVKTISHFLSPERTEGERKAMLETLKGSTDFDGPALETLSRYSRDVNTAMKNSFANFHSTESRLWTDYIGINESENEGTISNSLQHTGEAIQATLSAGNALHRRHQLNKKITESLNLRTKDLMNEAVKKALTNNGVSSGMARIYMERIAAGEDVSGDFFENARRQHNRATSAGRSANKEVIRDGLKNNKSEMKALSDQAKADLKLAAKNRSFYQKIGKSIGVAGKAGGAAVGILDYANQFENVGNTEWSRKAVAAFSPMITMDYMFALQDVAEGHYDYTGGDLEENFKLRKREIDLAWAHLTKAKANGKGYEIRTSDRGREAIPINTIPDWLEFLGTGGKAFKGVSSLDPRDRGVDVTPNMQWMLDHTYSTHEKTELNKLYKAYEKYKKAGVTKRKFTDPSLNNKLFKDGDRKKRGKHFQGSGLEMNYEQYKRYVSSIPGSPKMSEHDMQHRYAMEMQRRIRNWLRNRKEYGLDHTYETIYADQNSI
jgi:hypothetical protein